VKDFLDYKKLYEVTNVYKQEYIGRVIVVVTVDGEYRKYLQSESCMTEFSICEILCIQDIHFIPPNVRREIRGAS
jgi:hypothetical protein